MPTGDDLAATLKTYLDLYGRHESGPAVLLLPRWAVDQVSQLPADRRQALLDEIDGIAAAHGLRTPTIIEVADADR